MTDYAENTWCPGCGNFGILAAVKMAVKKLEEEGVPADSLMMTAGIGCHAKIYDYLPLSGVYSLHGRGTPAAQGMKIANPDLKVISFSGDGDGFAEGISHTIFAAKRNSDMVLMLHDNMVYALTTGQFTPLSPRGFKGRSTPFGSPEDPLHPVTLMLEAGATFVARGYSGKPQHLADLIVKAVKHPGFAFIDVLQPCVTFYNTTKEYNEKVVEEDNPELGNIEKAKELALRNGKIAIGVLYEVKKTVYSEGVVNRNVKNALTPEQRRDRLAKALAP